MRLPDAYESLTGAALTAAIGLLRRRPAGVDVRDAVPARIEVAIVLLRRDVCPRSFGATLAVVDVIEHPDLGAANDAALTAVKAAASDVRVRAGQAAVVARRVGGQP